MRLTNDHRRLAALYDAIVELERHEKIGKNRIESDEASRIEVISLLLLCATAAKSISYKLRKKHPTINWANVDKIASWLECCNAEIDDETIWLSLEREVPLLKNEVLELFQAVNTRVITHG